MAQKPKDLSRKFSFVCIVPPRETFLKAFKHEHEMRYCFQFKTGENSVLIATFLFSNYRGFV